MALATHNYYGCTDYFGWAVNYGLVLVAGIVFHEVARFLGLLKIDIEYRLTDGLDRQSVSITNCP